MCGRRSSAMTSCATTASTSRCRRPTWPSGSFSRPVCPSLLGFDPLMQFLHEEDAVSALCLALVSDVRGAFNIVGEGVLPYSTVLAMLGRLPLPLPRLVAYPLGRALWALQAS